MHIELSGHYGLTEDEESALKRAMSQFNACDTAAMCKLFGERPGAASKRVLNSSISVENIRLVRTALKKMRSA